MSDQAVLIRKKIPLLDNHCGKTTATEVTHILFELQPIMILK